MKKIILACAIITINIVSFAQTDTARHKTDHNSDYAHDGSLIKDTGMESKKNNDTKSDCAVMMASGKMMMMIDGKTVVMDKEMTMKNGTIVMMDGTVKMKGGKAIQMKDGDCLDVSGKMFMVKNDQIKKEPKTKK